jgi:hypothetical protein
MRRGIGVNQGRVLALLVLTAPRPVASGVLASIADAGGDQTRGRRSLEVMRQRGLIVHASPLRGVGDAEGPFWAPTDKGSESFHVWFRNRVSDAERGAR